MKRLTRSPFGILLRMIKENETRVKYSSGTTPSGTSGPLRAFRGVAGFSGALSILNYGTSRPASSTRTGTWR